MERLRLLREEKRITQIKLAMELGISQQRISRIENGESEVTESLLKKIAIYFDVSIDYLLGLSSNRKIITDVNDFLRPNTLLSLYSSLEERDRYLVNAVLVSSCEKWEKDTNGSDTNNRR